MPAAALQELSLEPPSADAIRWCNPCRARYYRGERTFARGVPAAEAQTQRDGAAAGKADSEFHAYTVVVSPAFQLRDYDRLTDPVELLQKGAKVIAIAVGDEVYYAAAEAMCCGATTNFLRLACNASPKEARDMKAAAKGRHLISISAEHPLAAVQKHDGGHRTRSCHQAPLYTRVTWIG